MYSDTSFQRVVGCWLDYLLARAPGAVVQLVLTQCDKLLNSAAAGAEEVSVEATVEAHSAAAAHVVSQLTPRVTAHLNDGRPTDAPTLRVQEPVVCVAAVESGLASIQSLRSRIRDIVHAHVLPSVGQKWNKTMLMAATMVRSLRDGRDVERAVKFAGELLEADAEPPKVEVEKALAYASQADANAEWAKLAQVAGVSGTEEVLAATLEETLSLMVREGELFRTAGVNFWQVEFVARVMRPLNDHRLGLQKNNFGRGNASVRKTPTCCLLHTACYLRCT